MKECTFCKIIQGDMSADLVYQDDRVTAFRDINPAAPVHILIVPNEHIASVNDLEPVHEQVTGHLFTVAQHLAEREGIHETGYRLIINNGPHAGQLVYHLHLHLLGGHRMRHPVG
jgi:histidine triad (HIT) family protein